MHMLLRYFAKLSIMIIALCIVLLPPLGYALVTAPLQVLDTVLSVAGMLCIGYAALVLVCTLKEVILMVTRPGHFGFPVGRMRRSVFSGRRLKSWASSPMCAANATRICVRGRLDNIIYPQEKQGIRKRSKPAIENYADAPIARNTLIIFV